MAKKFYKKFTIKPVRTIAFIFLMMHNAYMKTNITPTKTIKHSGSSLAVIAEHLQNNRSVKFIAAALIMAVSTVYFWAKRFKADGADSLRYRKRGRPTGSGRLLIPAQEVKIQAIIMSDEPKAHGVNYSTWTRRAVADLANKLFGIKIAERTIGDYLARWNMTPQKPRKYSIQRDEIKINEWIQNIFPAIAKLAKSVNAIIFFADETCVQTTDFNGRSFSYKGIKPIIHTLGTRLKTSIISAVSNNGMMRYMKYLQAMNSKIFISFMKQLINSARGNMVFLVVDNLRTHHSKLVAKWLDEHSDKIRIFFLPPYCPELNPDEYLNNMIKQKYRSAAQPASKEEFLCLNSKILKELQSRPDLIKKIYEEEHVKYASISGSQNNRSCSGHLGTKTLKALKY